MRFNIRQLVVITACISLLAILPNPATASECNNKLKGDLSAASFEIKQVLNSISKQFCNQQATKAKTWKTLRITSIQRTIWAQAGYIMSCLEKGCLIYENQPAISEYKSLSVKTKQTVADAIRDQIRRNCYISKHLSNRAVDIGTAGHSIEEVERLKKIIRSTPYIVDGIEYTAWIEDRSHGTGPHLHLNFEPYGFVPDQCPK